MDRTQPAFPALSFIVPSDLEAQGVRRLGVSQGMSLRDYFAAAALTGMLASGEWSGGTEVAEGAYDYADAMLEEGAKE
jgi:hypothetical protein